MILSASGLFFWNFFLEFISNLEFFSGSPPSGWKSFRNPERTDWKSVLSPEQDTRQSSKCHHSQAKPSPRRSNVEKHMPAGPTPVMVDPPRPAPELHDFFDTVFISFRNRVKTTTGSFLLRKGAQNVPKTLPKGAKSWNYIFVSRFTGKKDGDEWLGTVKDKINIYRLKIIKKSEKIISRFLTIGFALNSAQNGY